MVFAREHEAAALAWSVPLWWVPEPAPPPGLMFHNYTGPWPHAPLPPGPAAKRVPVHLIRVKGRGVQGVIGAKLNAGDALMSSPLVRAGDELVLASRGGLLTRCSADSLRVMSRGAKGAYVMRPGPDDALWAVTVLPGDSGHALDVGDKAAAAGKAAARAVPASSSAKRQSTDGKQAAR